MMRFPALASCRVHDDGLNLPPPFRPRSRYGNWNMCGPKMAMPTGTVIHVLSVAPLIM